MRIDTIHSSRVPTDHDDYRHDNDSDRFQQFASSDHHRPVSSSGWGQTRGVLGSVEIRRRADQHDR
jgi:hypothetical protein